LDKSVYAWFTESEKNGARRVNFKKISITTSALSDIETGKSKPGFEFFFNMVTIFDVNVDYLLQGEGEPFRYDEVERYWGRFGEVPLDEDMREFLTYFFHSRFVRFRFLSDFRQLMIEHGKTIKNDLEGDKGE
jgi:transcriptional regulator with XRE-family HTH domain